MDDRFGHNGGIDLSKASAQPAQENAQNIPPMQDGMQQTSAPQPGAFDQAAYNRNLQTDQSPVPLCDIEIVDEVLEKSTKAVIGLLCAAIGLVLGCCAMGGIFAVVGAVFAALSIKNKEPKSEIAISALIVSITAILINIVLFLSGGITMLAALISQ